MLCHVFNVEEKVVVIRNGWTPMKEKKDIYIYTFEKCKDILYKTHFIRHFYVSDERCAFLKRTCRTTGCRTQKIRLITLYFMCMEPNFLLRTSLFIYKNVATVSNHSDSMQSQ